MIKEITVTELKEMMDRGDDFQLIDVRESHEIEVCTLNGVHIPLATIPNSVDQIARDKPVVVHCRSGKRSASAIQFLQQNAGYDNLVNLGGGILAWADEIDPEMEQY